MHHKATITVGTATGRPYHIQCSCGVGGDFNKEAQAVSFAKDHFKRIGKVATSEIYVPGAKAIVVK